MHPHADMAPLQIAQFLAAKTIAVATAFLDGRTDAAALARSADDLCGELLVVSHDPACNQLIDPTRMLVVAMMRGAVAVGPRAQRWRCIMVAFVDLVRTEASALHRPAASPARTGRADVLQRARAE